MTGIGVRILMLLLLGHIAAPARCGLLLLQTVKCGLSVCLSVCHDREPCINGWTAVWVVDWWAQECIRWKSMQIPNAKGVILRGKGVVRGFNRPNAVSQNPQCWSTEENTKHSSKPVAWPHHFFIRLTDRALLPLRRFSEAVAWWRV